MLMDEPQYRLQLDSRISELSTVVPWAEALCDRHGLAEDTRYAVNLCLEEALANVVLHGYRNEPGHPILIEAHVSAGSLFFAVEDKAPPFAPVDPGERTPRPLVLDAMQPGGNGIRLIHRFAGSVTYEPLPNGNRLTIGFPVSVAKKVSA
jgi:serine/threonine-protein kinase RsbW